MECQCQRLLLGVEACHIPYTVGTLASQHHVLAWVAVDEACLLPSGGQLAQEVHLKLWQLLEVVGLHGYALHGSLHRDARGQFEDVGGLAGVTALIVFREVLVHDDASPVHRGRGVAAEGVECQVEGLTDGSLLVEEHILGCQHRLGCHEVWIHLLPSAGDSTAVEHYLQSVAVGIAEDVLIEAHRLLFVAAKEVYLDALDSYRLQPCHLPFTCDGGVHAVARALRRIVGEAVAVIP